MNQIIKHYIFEFDNVAIQGCYCKSIAISFFRYIIDRSMTTIKGNTHINPKINNNSNN
jgi:hypothetical protein